MGFTRVKECSGDAHADMTMTEKKAKAIAKMRVDQLRPIDSPRRSPNMAIHVSSNTLSLPAPMHIRELNCTGFVLHKTC